MNNSNYPMNLVLDLSTEWRPIDVDALPKDYDISVEYALRVMEEKAERDVQMVRMRYRDGMTFQAIGDTYGLTLERSRQCINKILRKIRSSLLLMNLICRGVKAVVEEYGKDQYAKGYKDGFTSGFTDGASSEGAKRSKTFHNTVDNIPLEDLDFLSVRTTLCTGLKREQQGTLRRAVLKICASCAISVRKRCGKSSIRWNRSVMTPAQ